MDNPEKAKKALKEDAANGLERDAWFSSSSSTHAIPTYRGGKEVALMSLRKPHRPVARGILFSRDLSTVVGGEKLGQQYWEVYIEVVIMLNESLIHSFQTLKTFGDAARKSIAWPSYLVVDCVPTYDSSPENGGFKLSTKIQKVEFLVSSRVAFSRLCIGTGSLAVPAWSLERSSFERRSSTPLGLELGLGRLVRAFCTGGGTGSRQGDRIAS
uniref:Transposase Tnp1/En/Spm-like domain-containing protein n=1 Tax=Ananas comosus var. bracteatus TaxID=296719 RepID=A0A6V7NTN7_ANACO|nr:unnamed protein product [Ananas comosus var. bracteatus]